MNRNLFQRIWDSYAGVFHIIAFIVMVIFMSGSYWTKWQAQASQIDGHEIRIAVLEHQNTQIVQHLEDIMDYLHVPQRPH